MQIEAEMLDTVMQLSASEAAAKEAADTPSPTKTANKLDVLQEKEYQASNAEDPKGMRLAIEAAAAELEMEQQHKKMAMDQAEANALGNQFEKDRAVAEALDEDLFHALNSMENMLETKAQYLSDR